MNYLKKREIYCSALKNETLINESSYKILQKDPNNFSYLPALTRWHNKIPNIIQKNNTTLKAISSILSILFVILIPFKLTFELIKSLFYKNKNIIKFDNFAFVNSKVNYDALNINKKEKDIIIYVSTKKNNKSKKETTHIFSCTTKKTKIQSYIMSIRFYTWSLLNLHHKEILNSHSSFLFFLTLNYLEIQKPKKIITSHHYDRWAILLDRYSFHSNDVLMQVDQHGLEREDFLNLMGNEFNKLKSTKILNSFNQEQALIFKKFIIHKDAKCNFNEKKTKNIKMETVKNQNNKTTVLFIGHPIYENLQIKLLNKLASKFDFLFFYKPHPTIKPSKRIKNQEWTIVDFFPKVDYFISYQSTLNISYEEIGIIGYIHGEPTEEPEVENEISKCLIFFDKKNENK